MYLEKRMTELKGHIEDFEIINERVSAKSVGWHIDHILRVNNGVTKVLKNSNPDDYRYNFSLVRSAIFLRNSIPRGRGKAPKAVVSVDEIEKSELLRRFEDNKKYMQEISTLPRKSNFKHPYFGLLNLKQTLKFIRIHTEHHLKIIRDIIK